MRIIDRTADMPWNVILLLLFLLLLVAQPGRVSSFRRDEAGSKSIFPVDVKIITRLELNGETRIFRRTGRYLVVALHGETIFRKLHVCRIERILLVGNFLF